MPERLLKLLAEFAKGVNEIVGARVEANTYFEVPQAQFDALKKQFPMMLIEDPNTGPELRYSVGGYTVVLTPPDLGEED